MKRVVIFAIDGLKADIFNKYVFEQANIGEQTSLRKLSLKSENGNSLFIAVDKAKSIFPSYTLPAWAAAFTGNEPKNNGIVGNSACYRDINRERFYDSFGLFYEKNNDAIRLFGWEWDLSNRVEISCQLITSGLEILGGFVIGNPSLLTFALGAWENAAPWIWAPHCFALHNGPWYSWKRFAPHKEQVIDFYRTGGIQNADLLSPTVYDYAQMHGLKTYVVHQFYNRTLNKASDWNSVYEGDIKKNIDSSWGRPSFKDIRDTYLSSPSDYRILDSRAFEKALSFIRSRRKFNILTIYTASIDNESHYYTTHGNNSLEEAQLSGLAFMDLHISNFIKTMKEVDPEGYLNTIFCLIADHGHTENEKTEYIAEPITFPNASNYGEIYLKSNSYMAHLYIKKNNWLEIPSKSDIYAFMHKVIPGATFKRNSHEFKLIGSIAFFVTRYQDIYRNWDGNKWEIFPLSQLKDNEYGFVDGAKRIEALLNVNRSGDLILIPGTRRSANGEYIKNIGFYRGDSSHGSLWPEDTYVPFCFWGEPINKALRKSGSIRIKECNLIDLTPTIMNYLNIYDQHSTSIDGKPIFDKDLNVNYQEFKKSETLKDKWVKELLFGRIIEDSM